MHRFIAILAVITGFLFASPRAEAIERQQATNWCWASAIQDILTPVGIRTSQAEVVQRLTGWLQNRPASTHEVAGLVRSYGVRANVVSRPGNVYELVGTLQSGYKIVALAYPSGGNIGHFIVLEGTDGSGVWVSDPATGMTQYLPIASLYTHWRWSQSIVVG